MKIRVLVSVCLLFLVLHCQSAQSEAVVKPLASKVVTADKDLSVTKKLDRLLVESRAEKARNTEALGDLAKTDDMARPKPIPKSSTDKDTRLAYEKALQDYYRYRSHGLEHRKAVFSWQLFSAKMIFAIVVVLVVSGIVFAGIQFRHGLARSVDNLGGDIEVKTDGFKVSSPVLGVIILFLSLAFFYLYLVHIYPIEIVF